jgi:N6-L-threonylcarbamoyladenine synthase
LGLGYPGGPVIDRASAGGQTDFFRFPRARLEEDSLDFSFSGLKTAVALCISKLPEKELHGRRVDIAASFQEAVVDALLEKAIKACHKKNAQTIALAGGVARNRRLREKLEAEAKHHGLRVFYPSPVLCTDNAAMIAAAGDFHFSRGEVSGLDLNAIPYAPLVPAL